MNSIYLCAFVAGAWLLQQQPVLPEFAGAAVLVPLALLWKFFSRRTDKILRTVARIIAALVFTVAGFFWAAGLGHWKLADDLPEIWQGRDIDISGVIAQMVQPNERGVRFVFDVDRVYSLNAQVPSRISLMWYEKNEESTPELHAGQRWRFTVRLQRPHGNANPGGFDLEAWMLERGIRATGYVRSRPTQPEPKLTQGLAFHPAYLLERAREATRDHLLATLAGRPYGGVVVALAVGDQQAIPAEQWRIFTRTGVNHLISISGLHITMVASLVVMLVLRLWRKSEKLMLRIPAVRAAAVFGFLTAFTYAALSGFAVPAQRTVYMLAVVAIALWYGWATRPTAVLAAAAALVILLDPMAVIVPGFWLSFGAVAVIMLAAGSRIGKPNWWRAWAQTQWAVTLALVPLLLAMFQQVSLVSPVANAVAIPLVSLIVVPLALLASLVPLDVFAYAAHQVMAVCMIFLRLLGELPDAVWQQHAPPAWSVVTGVAGALLLLMPKGFPARWIGALLMFPLFLAVPAKIPSGELRLTVLDVGQGLAVVVRTHDHTLLYDTGPSFTEQIDAGGRIVVPYLRAVGIRKLDAMIISHNHADHSGGALSVMQALPVESFVSSAKDDPIAAAAKNIRLCQAGQRWIWDEVSFEFLYPRPADYNEQNAKDNDRSCVLRIVSDYGSVLLPGDIEKNAESRLLQSSGNLRSDLLLAPHHGSRTSSTPGFVKAVAPQLTVFSVGYLNRFGHPHPLISARYHDAESRTLRTDSAGAVLVAITPAGLQVEDWQYADRRDWSGR